MNNANFQILIATKDDKITYQIKQVLQQMSYSYVIATSGNEVLALIRKSKFELLIVTEDLCDFSAIELVELIKKTSYGKTLTTMLLIDSTGSEANLPENTYYFVDECVVSFDSHNESEVVDAYCAENG